MEKTEKEEYDDIKREVNVNEVKFLDNKRSKQPIIHSQFDIPLLNEINEIEEISQLKDEKTKNKANEFIQNLEETVQNYTKKVRTKDFSVDPQIKKKQIVKAEKQLLKIAKYLESKTIDDEHFCKDKLSYVEILENTKNIIENSIKNCRPIKTL